MQFEEDGLRLGLDWVGVSVVLWAVIAYCIYGAAQGMLFIPHRHSYGHDAYLSGQSAWAIVAGLIIIWLGVSVRMGLFQSLARSPRTVIEMLLLFAGLAMLFLSQRLPTIVLV